MEIVSERRLGSYSAGDISNEVNIRPARADDSDFLGWVIFTAARGHLKRGWFDVALARDEAFCIEYCSKLAAAAVRSWWHWSLFSVAEVNGRLASAVCGFGDRAFYAASSAAMAEASQKVGLSEEEHAQLWPRGAFILSCATSEDDAWTIENMATRPEYRRTGTTGVLLKHELERARADGYRRVQISFCIGNTAAERAYSKAGFKFAEEKCSSEFQSVLGVPGLR
jgi:GNAT superfamily N-acetyltransferase